MTLAVGSTVVITWEDTILHDGIGYDLDLVDVSKRAQSAIVHGLPTSQHRYDWRVPDVSCVGCYLVVAQVNNDHDYFDSVLVNIYGKPAAVAGSGGSGGTGGSSENQGGTTGTLVGAAAGGTASGSMGGSGGTLPGTTAGSSGGTAAVDPGAAGSPAEESGGAAGAEPAEPIHGQPSPSAAAGADAESAGVRDGSTTELTAGSPNSDGCTIDRRAPSRSGSYFALVALLLAFVTRKRRIGRSNG